VECAAEERLKLRRLKSKPIVDEIRSSLEQTAALPEGSLRTTMEYAAARWSGLTRFLDDGEIPLTNNGPERALRGPVVGRKNHYASKSEQGTAVAALFYSLMESAALCHLDVRQYQRHALNEG
jgi:hypothetical protein